MSGIQDLIQSQLTPDTINQISSAIGADPATTRQAVDAAVPMMMGGMAQHAASPAGASAIESAAGQHAGMLDGLGGMLGGAAGGLGGVLGGLGGMLGGAGGAGGILGSILGSSHSQVQDGVTQASGLDRQKTAKLLMMLAPIVLAAIAHHKQTTNATATQIGSDLQREAQMHAQHPQFGGILGGILNKATGQA
ncbi:MAG TPA: DUF937 domain-containing protein [Gemmatimonadaceae bacterium]|nr:DUF937 domain-containing protein [Gemmatimonadaceae bacterium]